MHRDAEVPWLPPVLGRLDPPPRRRFDPVVDLGRDVGSPTWWRGVATLVSGIAMLVHLAPGIEPLPAASHAAASAVEPREDRASGIAPTAPRPLMALPATRPERRRVDLAATTRPLDAASVRARSDTSLARRGDGGQSVLARIPIAAGTTPTRISGEVGVSLYHAMRGAGVPFDVLADYLRAIEPHVDIGDIRPDDRFDIVMERRRAATGKSETGRLLYAGMVHDGAPLRLLRWTLGGREQWFDAAGAGRVRSGFAMPVAGTVTSGFGMRFHPILGYSRMHQGVDLAAPVGTPIVAASDGVVRFAGWHGGHGNYVLVAHAGGLATGYGHMSSIVAMPGMRVSRGELIGYVGSTGLSTGPHLHFEVFRDGVAIDPASVRLDTAPQLAGAQLAAFRQRLARLIALPAG